MKNLIKIIGLNFILFQGLQTQALEAAPIMPEFSMENSNENLSTHVLGEFSKDRWVIPYFFNAELDCLNSATIGNKVLCKINLYNSLNEEQESYIKSLKKEGQTKVYFINDVHSFVLGLEESFDLDDIEYVPDGGMPTSNGRLNLSSDHPYQSIYMRVPPSKVESLKTRFKQKNGIGSFQSSFTINSYRNIEYLRVNLNPTQMNELKSYVGKNLKYEDRIQKVSEWLRTASFVSSHLSLPESEHIAEMFLRKLVFGKYGELIKESLDGDSVILIEGRKEIKIKCWAQLSLARDAKSQVSCEELRTP